MPLLRGEDAPAPQVRRRAIEWALTNGAFPSIMPADQDKAWFHHARLMLVLLVNRCELPDGFVTDCDPAELGRAVGLTESQAIEALDVLSAQDLACQIGALTPLEARYMVHLPVSVFEPAELAYHNAQAAAPNLPRSTSETTS